MNNHTIASMLDSAIITEISSDKNISAVIDVVRKMTKDPVYDDILMNLLNNNKPETRAFVAWLARTIQPSTYLEVGTRRGWSLVNVAVAAPQCKLYSFDEWHENYGGAGNPGPAFVKAELAALGCKNEIEFVSGDSHKTLRNFFKTNPKLEIDMILIDGDHTIDGAYQDLKDTMSHISVGGAMVFDDVLDCEGLLGVWHHIEKEYPNFKYVSYTGNSPGVSFGIRLV